VGVTIGHRMLTITAWENPQDPQQLMKGGVHAEAVKKFFSPELGAGAFTCVLVPERINTMWVRCEACQKMMDAERAHGVCSCGATLPAAMPYW